MRDFALYVAAETGAGDLDENPQVSGCGGGEGRAVDLFEGCSGLAGWVVFNF